MSISHTVAEILQDHVTLEVESIDRMYLNVYVPRLQSDRGDRGTGVTSLIFDIDDSPSKHVYFGFERAQTDKVLRRKINRLMKNLETMLPNESA